MSGSSSDWLSIKHGAYSLVCGERDSDWDFADTPSRGGYSFASSDAPIPLLNNTGGMDEETVVPKDIWVPFQTTTQQSEVAMSEDSEMSDDQASGDDMDVEMEVGSQQVDHQHQQQASTAGKRKRGAPEVETGAYYQQLQAFDRAKRVRIGA